MIRERVRRLPGGNTMVRLAVFLLGLFFILLGLALSVLPGPLTIPPVLLGLVIWALEFAWAERLVERARKQALDAWDAARAHPWRAGLVTGSGLVLLVVALLLAARFELVDRATSLLS
ncbi:MAG: PGPGW domain-containing protein [Mycobacteriales bacterium]